jgi:hypothetical protein
MFFLTKQVYDKYCVLIVKMHVETSKVIGFEEYECDV